MSFDPDSNDEFLAALRARALSALEHTGTGVSDRVLHELRVHQVELQLQNEELMRTQAALVDARDRYAALFDFAPVAYVGLDRTTTIKEANHAAALLLGVQRTSLLGRPLVAFMDEASADRFQLHLREVLGTSTRATCDVQLRTDARELREVHVESIAQATRGGQSVQGRCVLIDVTDLRRAEDQRAASEVRAQTVLDTVTDAIVTADGSGRIQSLNRAAQAMFGWSEADALGKDVRILMPPAEPQKHGEALAHYLATGEARVIGEASREVTGRRRDGTTFPVDLAIGEWAQGGDRRFTAVIRDVSARDRARSDLRDSETQLREVTEHIGDAVVILDRDDRRVTYANRAFEQIFGQELHALDSAGPLWPDGVHPDDRDRIEQAYTGFAAGARFDETYRILRPDHEMRWVRARAFPVLSNDGHIHRDVAVIQDITQEHQLAEELRQAQKMEAVGALASGVAHDFNNLLQAVLGCINIARREGTPPDEAKQHLDRAALAALRGGELAGQLMAFSRKQDAVPAPIDIDAVIERVSELLARLLTEQIALEIHTGTHGTAIVADPVQVEQILMNLAANARDAMPEGGALSIHTAVLPGSHAAAQHPALDDAHAHVRIVVKDTGVGMDTETVARIFEPFFTTKDVGKGTGLGLSTVFAVVRQLGGKIGVDSEPGRGTTFTLWFPAVERAIARAPAAPIALPRFRGTALVVEDEPLVRLTVAHYLQELGLDVSTAEDANEAMRVCDEHQGSLDLLVCDIVLPVMRGPDLAELVRARYPGLRMLFMSATLESEGRFASDRGDAPVLVKPFGLEDLARALESLPDPPSRRPDEDHAPNPGARAPESTTVLLVEDQEASRLAIGDLLETEGYRTLVAESAEAALQHADQPLHVLLTDVHLPDMPGNALAERLRRDHPDLRVIFMSGDTHPPDGATEFVQKPIHLDALLDLLAHDPPRAPTGLPRGRERC